MPGPNEDTNLLRAQVDDAVRALIRTQHIVSLAGNVFTGGLEEPVFDIHIDKITRPDFRPGSPAAGALTTFCRIILLIHRVVFFLRWTAVSCDNLDQVRGVAD